MLLPKAIPAVASSEQVAPHSIDAERGILGSILLAPNESVPECIAAINMPWFYVPAHQAIYNLMVEEWQEGHPIDLIAFTEALRGKKILETVGGAAFITNLYTFLPSPIALAYYLGIVREKYLLRQIIIRATEAVRRAYSAPDEPNALLTELQNDFLSLGEAPGLGEIPLSILTTEAMDNLAEACTEKGSIPGLSTGLTDLDKVLGGMRPKQLIILAGETGEGKTSLGLTILEHLGLTAHHCGIVSLEMSGPELCESMIGSIGQVDLHSLITSGARESDYPRIMAAATKLSGLPIFIRDDVDVDPLRLRAIGRQLKHRHQIELLIVDYIQLLTPTGTKDENREQAVSGSALALKQMAKELGIVVIGISQLNEAGKLRESRAIGHHADKILTISHDEDDQSFIHVNKNRRGPVGDVAVTFLRKYTKFVNAARPMQTHYK